MIDGIRKGSILILKNGGQIEVQSINEVLGTDYVEIHFNQSSLKWFKSGTYNFDPGHPFDIVQVFSPNRTFKRGDRVRKKGNKGQWQGHIVGEYSTECTPEGYAVESERELNSVQIYPVEALEFVKE